MTPIEDGVRAFRSAGYLEEHRTSKVILFRAPAADGRRVYLDLKVKGLKIVIHDEMYEVAKAHVHYPAVIGPDLFHLSNMRKFRERQHGGRKPTRCGWPIRFQTGGDLEKFLEAYSEATS